MIHPVTLKRIAAAEVEYTLSEQTMIQLKELAGAQGVYKDEATAITVAVSRLYYEEIRLQDG